MAGLATKETNKSVHQFIQEIENPARKDDSKKLLQLIEEITGYTPKIWGDHFIIGFGKYTYTRKGKKEEYEWFNVGFAPRKTNITIYLTLDLTQQEELLNKLGTCKWGKGCLYIKTLADIDIEILKQLIEKSKNARWH